MKYPGLQEHELLSINKPAQYLGGEPGSVLKDDTKIDTHLCLAFPDTYEVGMSHTGYQILYDLLNKSEKVWAERAYVPLPDMEELLRSKNAPLCSLESHRPLSAFDVVGFSLQYELCMSGILLMLDLGGISLLASERTENDPLVIGGGPVAYHPEPFADFFDAFLIGDGEELVPEFLEKFAALKESSMTREEQLKELSRIQGVYVPRFFEPHYNDNQHFSGYTPQFEDYTSVDRRVIATLENAPFPTNPLIPNIEAVHDRLSVEVMRGCVRGCRFCQAGYLYRPQRERSPEELKDIIAESLKNSGYEELSLLSLSTADYCSILPLLRVLKEDYAQNDTLAISFPSTRVDALTPELLSEVQPVRRSGFTMAPEAGTQRLRDVINKGVTDEQIIETIKNVFRLGWSSVKLYFMIGLPTETDEDVQGIIDIAYRVKDVAGPRNQVTISVSTHIPKPHTPFQWAPQMSIEETTRKQKHIAFELKKKRINFRYHDAYSSFLEGVFARGDRKLGRVILEAYKRGARLDGWSEKLQYEHWMRAFEACDIDPQPYLEERDTKAPLSWDHISCDIPKRWFLKEWDRASASRTTPDCLTQTCSTCGSCNYDSVRNVLFDRKRSQSRLKIIDPSWEEIIEGRGDSLLMPEELCTQTPGERHKAHQAEHEPAGTYSLKEYLKTEVDTKRNTLRRPDQPILQRIRLRYAKFGPMRFTAHLELMRIFFRTTRRAGLPIVFTRGFHPQPKFAFGPPLQLGVESECEYVDIPLFERLPLDEFCLRLNKEFPEGLQARGAVEISAREKSIQSSITAQDYSFRSDTLTEIPTEHFHGWTGRNIERVRKGKAKTLPLADFVSSASLEKNEGHFSLKTLSTGASLKPFEVVEALTRTSPFQFRVMKEKASFLTNNGETTA